jgi:hypothetical protein
MAIEIFPIGHRIMDVSGVAEQEDVNTQAKHWLGVLRLDDGAVALLAQNGVARMFDIPSDTRDIPANIIDGGDVNGNLISNVIIRKEREGQVKGPASRQLFLILDHERIMGILPSQQGAILHIESVLSSPLLRGDDHLVTITNKCITMDEIVGI